MTRQPLQLFQRHTQRTDVGQCSARFLQHCSIAVQLQQGQQRLRRSGRRVLEQCANLAGVFRSQRHLHLCQNRRFELGISQHGPHDTGIAQVHAAGRYTRNP